MIVISCMMFGSVDFGKIDSAAMISEEKDTGAATDCAALGPPIPSASAA